jgi:hypothetical protein
MLTDGVDLFFSRQIEENSNVAYLSDALKDLVEEDDTSVNNSIVLDLTLDNGQSIKENLIEFSKNQHSFILLINTKVDNIKDLFKSNIKSINIFLDNENLKCFNINNNVDFSFKRITVDNYILEIKVKES